MPDSTAVVARLQQRVASLENQLLKARTSAVASSAAAEMEAESMTNKLASKLQALAASKEQLALEVEAEEEAITNGLQRQLRELRLEKVSLENQLEQEQEMITNRLNRQVLDLRRERAELQHRAESSKLVEQLEAAGLPALLLSEVRDFQVEHERALEKLREENRALSAENKRLTDEAFLLQQRASMESEKKAAVQQEKILLEHELEAEDERSFNEATTLRRGSRSASGVSVGGGDPNLSPALRYARSPSQTRRRSSAASGLQASSMSPSLRASVLGGGGGGGAVPHGRAPPELPGLSLGPSSAAV